MSSTTTSKAQTAGKIKEVTGGVNPYRRLYLSIRLVLIALAILFAMFPVIWIFSASLNPSNSLASGTIIPSNASLDNYDELLNTDRFPFLRWVFNSFYIAAITATLSTLITAVSAYAFSRFRFRGRQSLLLLIFLIQVFPNSLTIVATYLLIQTLGDYIPVLGINAHGGLILVYLGGVLGINTWLMKGYLDTIPRDLDESAKIDGASDWLIFWRIILPLARPVLAVIGILGFIGVYNDYIMAVILLQDSENFTLAVGLNQFLGDQFSERWGPFAAGALMGALPVVAVYMLVQDFLVSGLTAGAVKG
jgi:ABC-type maltose transport system permease subunit